MMSTQRSQPSTVTPPASPRLSPSLSPVLSTITWVPASASSPVPVSPPSSAELNRSLELTGAPREVFLFLKDQTNGIFRRRPYSALLTKEEHKALEDKILKDSKIDSYYHQTSWDWFPPTDGKNKGRLVFPMPTRVHNEFRDYIRDALAVRIAKFGQDPTNAAYAAASELSAKTDLDMDRGDGTSATPDAAFEYAALKMDYSTLPLIIEVGYTQTPKDIREKAEMWLNTFGVETVLTFDLPYQSPELRAKGSALPRDATYTVFRAIQGDDGNWDVDEVKATFCTAAKAVQEGQLQLTLNDFLPETHLLGSDVDPPISVPHNDLTQFLTQALRLQNREDRPRPQSSKKITLKRDPDHSPSQGSSSTASSSALTSPMSATDRPTISTNKHQNRPHLTAICYRWSRPEPARQKDFA